MSPAESCPRTVVFRREVGGTAHLRHLRRVDALQIRLLQPQIVCVLEGSKRVIGPQRQMVTAHAGDLVVLPAGHIVDLVNLPGAKGRYEAISLGMDETTVIAAERQAPQAAPVRTPLVLSGVSEGCRAAFMRARAGILDGQGTPPEIARHAVLEVLLWMSTLAWRFESNRKIGFAEQLRILISSQPELAWSSASAASAMAVSEATLRRRLAEQGDTLTALLLEVRTTSALGLLQATDAPVTQVALDCGFKSHSHFSKVFKARFGFAPRDLRQAEA